MQTIELTDQQNTAIGLGCLAYDDGTQLYRIGGYAGTGKTTVLKQISDQFPNAAVCAYTGKAANVLRKKGVQDASTIHRRIYEWNNWEEKFVLRDPSEFFCSGFLVDEASMLSSKLYEDMLTFQKPIIAVGDPGQLEPISDKDINLMHQPDYTLNTIHRQAADNPIIQLADHIRHDNQMWIELDNGTAKITEQSIFSDSIEWADILICGFRKTRFKLNKEKRLSLGYTEQLYPGEKLICLVNDYKLGVFNGQGFTVVDILEEEPHNYRCILRTDEDFEVRLKVFKHALGTYKTPDYNDIRPSIGRSMIADYGYAITCHKAQGSEWDKVAICRETCEVWNQPRWDYTAVTRAAEEVRVHI